MTTPAQIEAFLACKRIGFVGVSQRADDFSRDVFRELVARGYDVVPIHPTASAIEGRPAFASVVDAAEAAPLEAVYVMTPASATENVLHDCHTAGVRRVWLHRGTGEGAYEWHAVRYAKAHHIDVIEGECVMMFLPGAHAIHRVHGQLRRIVGHYPDVVDEPTPHRVKIAAGYGVLAWALSTWAMLAIAGMFTWDVGMAARAILIPAAFALVAWMHAEPGRLAPLPAASVFAIVWYALDALGIAGFVERDASLLASLELTLIPLALAFWMAIVAGMRYRKPVDKPMAGKPMPPGKPATTAA